MAEDTKVGSGGATYTALDDLTHYRPTLKRKLDVVKSSEFVEMEPGLGEYVKVEDVRRLLSAVATDEGYPGIAHDFETMRVALAEALAAKDAELAAFRKNLGRDPLVKAEWVEKARAALLLRSTLAAAPLISEELIKDSSSNPPAIDLEREMWEAIKIAAKDSVTLPPDYMMNDWVSDVCEFLRTPRVPTSAVGPKELVEVLDEIEDYLGQHQDVLDGGDGPRPNKAMRLLGDLAEARTEWARGEYRRSTVAIGDQSDIGSKIAKAITHLENAVDEDGGVTESRHGVVLAFSGTPFEECRKAALLLTEALRLCHTRSAIHVAPVAAEQRGRGLTPEMVMEHYPQTQHQPDECELCHFVFKVAAEALTPPDSTDRAKP